MTHQLAKVHLDTRRKCVLAAGVKLSAACTVLLNLINTVTNFQTGVILFDFTLLLLILIYTNSGFGDVAATVRLTHPGDDFDKAWLMKDLLGIDNLISAISRKSSIKIASKYGCNKSRFQLAVLTTAASCTTLSLIFYSKLRVFVNMSIDKLGNFICIFSMIAKKSESVSFFKMKYI
ncbi:MAG: hypothetical protein CMK92_06215 [Pseudomonas sp.]|nr:hypothetical protein [Pseudomonas sp.]